MRNTTRPIRRMLGSLTLALVLSGSFPAESPVADAAMNGNLVEVRSLIESGADVNASQGDGMTALHWAAENGDVDMVRALLFAGAFPDATTRNAAYTPLHLGARAGRSGTVEALLMGGADPTSRTVTGVTPLHFAASAAAAESVELLLTHGAVIDALETASGQTPLIFAAAANRADAIEALVDAGAQLGVQTTVIDVSARSAEDRQLRALRDERKALEWSRGFVDGGYGGSPEAEAEEEDEAEADEEPEDDVEVAEVEPADEEKEEPDEVVTRLSFSQLIDKKGGMTALLHAAREGHAEALEVLVRRGAALEQRSADGTSPLLIATINGHFDVAARLLELGADPNVASDAGATALYGAINLQWGPTSWYPQPNAFKQQTTSYLELMEALLQAGADPNARLERELWYTEFNTPRLSTSHWGATAFWRAAYGTDVDALKLLVEYGADPDIASRKKPGRSRDYPDGDDADGRYPLPPIPIGGPAESPIHVASGAGYGLGFAGNAHRHKPDGWLPTVRYLVEELGADVNIRDQQGYTPLHNAASRGDNDMIRYLVERGAELSVVSRYGQTAADMANGPYQRISPFPETLALLEGLGVVNHHNCVSC